ncbi:Permease of the drug/metabolite transporter (DMT) superfamily [Marinobacter daqiaonensis]|uniref:Permease of the drug/metabolite transporter (DMT) superfamily n=1 Tax=Marinobacter daqiaonensis TaxID=650891 RepID=A0A1I6IAK5_9GAMM|nr:DMT family transporter [Marinobacter daqiaonensis]SFR63410.1 Permease of the drug/metabolite transporter (DMT) superfamily [Marinobacter daqiaonensis]
MPQAVDRSLALAYVGLVLTPLFWAGNAVVARGVVETIPPASLSFWRWVIALVVILPFGIRGIRQEWRTVRQYWRSMLVLSFFSVTAFNTLLYLAAITTTAINIALINSTIPIMVALLALLLLGERTRPHQVLGIAVALAGMLIVIGQGKLERLTSLSFAMGDLIMVTAVASWGIFSVLLRRFAVPLKPLTFLTVQIALGTIILAPVYLVDLLWFSGGFRLTPGTLPPLLYVAFFPGILAYAFWNHGVLKVGPARSAMFMYLTPVYAAVLAWVFLGERLGWFHLAGGAFILAGLYLTTRNPAPAPRPDRP